LSLPPMLPTKHLSRKCDNKLKHRDVTVSVTKPDKDSPMTDNYNISGPARSPVFALHSSASSGNQWARLIGELAGWFDVIAPDLPGYAKNGVKPGLTIPTGDANCAPIILEMENRDEPVHLVGHSYGAAIAINIALSRPDLIKSLTLYEPAAFHFLNFGSGEDRQLFAQINQISGLLTAGVASGRPDLGMQTFIDFWNGEGSWENTDSKYRQIFEDNAYSVMNDFARGYAETWSLEDLSELEMPTLMMAGMQSPLIAQSVAIQIADAIPNSQFTMFTGLGHMAPAFQPERINPRIHDHLAGVERRASNFFQQHRSAA
jgi:pimeloyl-ACP methyl ester carboxylesterase